MSFLLHKGLKEEYGFQRGFKSGSFLRTGGEDTKAPVFIFAEVGTVSSKTLRVIYSERLDDTSTPATGDFVVGGDSILTVVSVLVYSNVVQLTLQDDVEAGTEVTISYTKGVNPIRDRAENEAINLVDEPVTNNGIEYWKDFDGNYVLDTDGNKIPLNTNP